MTRYQRNIEVTMRKSRLLVFVVPALSVVAAAQDPEAVYNQLRSETFYVHPKFTGKLDTNQIRVTADQVKPYSLKVLVVPQLGTNWRRGTQENRDGFAKSVAGKIGQGSDGITIVLTNKGIAAYNPKISTSSLVSLQRAAVDAARSGGADAAINSLATGMKAQLSQTRTGTVAPDRLGNQSVSSGSSWVGGLLCLAIPAALIGGVALLIRNAGLKQARNQANNVKNKATEALAYLDSYDGLIDDATDASAVRQYRDRMAQNYDEGLGMLNRAKKKVEIEAARRQLALVLQDFESAKQHIDHSTGGTGMAFSIPPIVDSQRAPLFEPVQGVSYFSSQPSDQLVPVEMNFGGQRRTVMVTHQERDQLMQGQMPQMRGSYVNQRFTPWYQVQGYDPYRHYDSRDFLWDMMAINAVSNMFAPHYGFGYGGGLFGGGWDYGHHGYHDHGTTIINNYGDSNGYNTSSSGDFDFGSSNDWNTSSSGDFDFGGGGDSGGFDFGGGDSGGDSGGGGDF